MVLAVIEEHARVGAVDAVVDVVALLAVAHGLADDFDHQGGGGGYQGRSGGGGYQRRDDNRGGGRRDDNRGGGQRREGGGGNRW